jgi:fatty-acyl-CoA synthase
MENNIRYLEVAWAAQRSGLYYTAINSHLRQGEVDYIIADCGAKALITSVAVEAQGGATPIRLTVGDDYDAAIAAFPDTPISDEMEGREMLYSSGTTGRPKGVRKLLPRTPMGDPSAPPVAIAKGLLVRDVHPGSVYLSPAPMYHSAPLVYSMSMQRLGATVVIMEHFDPAECLALIERYRVTHAQFVPTMFVRMLQLPAEQRATSDLSSLTFVVHAAAPCPVHVKRQMLDWWGPIIDEYYASSEAIGSTLIAAEDWLAHPGSVGKPMLGGVHILGEDGNELPPGHAGEIYFEGGYSFEYLNDPAKTAASRDNHGWVTVGDVGYLDDEGYLFLTDRRHHMIISGGVNIYPQETENLLITHPKVLDAAVFGVPDDGMGQRVMAAVQTVDPADATDEFADELLCWLRDRLSHFKCPRSIAFEAQLPRTDTGKLYKNELIEKYSA